MTNIRKNKIEFDNKNWKIGFDSNNNLIAENETTGGVITFGSDGSMDVQSLQTESGVVTSRFSRIKAENNFYVSPLTVESLTEAGTGSVQRQPVRLLLDPGTAGHVVNDPIFTSWQYPSWDNPRATRISAWVEDPTQAVCMGIGKCNPNNTDDVRVGARIEGGSLYAEASQGSGLTVDEELRTVTESGGQYDVLVELDGDGGGNLTVSQREKAHGSSKNWEETYEFTSGLPTGDGADEVTRSAWSVGIANNTAQTFAHINHAACEMWS